MSQPVEERVAAVRILLSSFYDYLPDPVTGSGLIARSVPSGPAPGKRVPCGYCRRTGRVAYGERRSRACPLCNGTAWRTRRRRKHPSHPLYEPPWDEYVASPVEEEATPNPRPMSARSLDAQLERIGRDQDLREGVTSGERFGWERERAAYERQGSYRELGRALHELAEHWPPGYLHVRRSYLRGLHAEPSQLSLSLTAIAEEWIAREMRGPVRVPVWLSNQVAESRQASLAELAAQGLTAGQIARRLRIPKLKVQRMLRSEAQGKSFVPAPGRRGKASYLTG